MVRTIARVEFTQLHRDGRFRVSLVIVFLLLIAALGAGWTHFRYVNEERRIAQQDARGVWLEQAEKNPHSAAHFGTYAFRPQMPLSLVDAGLDPYVGTTIYLEAHKQNESDFAPAQDRTALQRFGELTAATLLQSVFPLIIIFFTFSSFAGEREAGTLKQVLSLGVRSRDLVLGKFLGIATAFAVVLGPATILGVAALGLSAAGEASWLNYSRLLWMTGGYVLYLAATLAVALAVSAYARSSHLALIVLLGFWIMNTLIAPRLATDISKSISPIPSSAEFWTAVQTDIHNGIDGHDPENRRQQELLQKLLKQYGVSRVQELPFNFGGMALQASEEYGNLVFDSQFRSLWDSYERQGRIQQTAGVIAPVLAIRSLSMGMAGTDFAHYRRFAVAAEAYRRQMVKTLNDDLAQHAKPGVNYVAGRDVWERIPDFVYQMPGTRWAIANQTISLAVLALWCALGGLAAIAATSRIVVVERGY